jgi:hypothetical protein
MDRKPNKSYSYIFNLKIKKNDSSSIIRKNSSLLAKKGTAHHNKMESKDQKGSTPYQERKYL